MLAGPKPPPACSVQAAPPPDSVAEAAPAMPGTLPAGVLICSRRGMTATDAAESAPGPLAFSAFTVKV